LLTQVSVDPASRKPRFHRFCKQVLRLASLCQLLSARYGGEWTLSALDGLGISTIALILLAGTEWIYCLLYVWRTFAAVRQWSQSVRAAAKGKASKTSSWDDSVGRVDDSKIHLC
jgi:hypothetical protein